MNLSKEIRTKWPSRSKTSHKGDFGRVAVIAGSKGMIGAAILTSAAAMRTGAGLVKLIVPETLYTAINRKIIPDVMVHPVSANSSGSLSMKASEEIRKILKTQDVVAIGPGLSQQSDTQKLIRKIVAETKKPIVLDADGLNAFAGFTSLLKKHPGDLILTPHPGEFKRLFGDRSTEPMRGQRLTMDLSLNRRFRKKIASRAAKHTGTLIALKGHHTVIASAGKAYVNTTGNPGMAKGGFGDVLTGMIAAFLGQGFSSWDAARFAVYLHGKAADQLVKIKGEASLLAGDLVEYLPQVIKEIRGI